jgi:hypothetical protein
LKRDVTSCTGADRTEPTDRRRPAEKVQRGPVLHPAASARALTWHDPEGTPRMSSTTTM